MALDRKIVHILTYALVALALILTGLGGFIDMTGTPLHVSKEHAWNDGLFLLGLAILLNVVA